MKAPEATASAKVGICLACVRDSTEATGLELSGSKVGGEGDGVRGVGKP